MPDIQPPYLQAIGQITLVHLMDRFAEQASDPFRHSLEAYGRLLPRFENLRPQKVSAALRRTDLSVPEPP